ncbi:hypothetical protein ARMGADRAFT_670011 [Armillaria gallica]|uniref:Aldehyde dehydrogenase domain-containing protein n=1 Tax=Armillaria gallica TaxID=47427 RepID=A0A2H3CY78_ARMGA|nr:hypothetical protein ARMGADRAFT_670011 [Armillaria gallica]
MSKDYSPVLTAAHRLVRKINFTGTDRVGRIIAGEGAKYPKPYVFEFGGKAPAIVLNDAVIDAAAKDIVFGALVSWGQRRSANFATLWKPEIQRLSSLFCFPKLRQSMFQGDWRGSAGPRRRFHEGRFCDTHVFTGAKLGTRLCSCDTQCDGYPAAITTIDEAVELADSALSSSLWTLDLTPAERLCKH